MLTNIKIGTKITILLLAVVFLSVFAISYLSYTQSKNSVNERYAESFSMISATKASQISSVFRQTEQDINYMVGNRQIKQALTPTDSTGNLLTWNDSLYTLLNQQLDRILIPIQSLSQYSNIFVTDIQGKVLYRNDKNQNDVIVGNSYRNLEKLLQSAQGQAVYYGEPFRYNNQGYMHIAAPVFLTEEEVAQYYIIIAFNLSQKIYPLIEATTGLGETGEILLCKLSGRIVNIISPLRNSDATILTQKVIIGDKMISVQKAAQAIPPDFAQDIDYRDKKTLSYWNHIKPVNWGLVVKIDEEEVTASLDGLLYTFLISGSVIVFLSLLISTIFSRFLINPILSLKNRLNLVSKGILPESNQIEGKDEIGEMAVAVQELVSALRRTANFAHQIGEGNYDADFTPMSEDDTLGNALLTMRDSIQGADKKDRERNWIVSGVAEIGQILRLHNNLEELGDEIISFITEKIQAVQGAFYVTTDDDDEATSEAYLEMKASYAYHKKKYLQAKFKFAEGLVGQCAIEQDTILRTEIPENYVTITSGILGDQRPTCLLFVPLITDEKVFGVLEFAGFEQFTSTHVSFVEEISVIIARTIFNIKVNERTVRLLQESQQMSEELQLQQEILRQNAEEMEATQEELTRTNTRLEDQILEVNRSQKRLQVLLENASEVITIYEKNGKIRYVSPSIEPILGYTQDEMIGINDIVNVHPESANVFKDFFENLIQNPNERQNIQYEYRKKNNETVWLEATGTNLLSDSAISGIVVNSRNITERRRAEREERMRSQMQALSENSPDLITRVNSEGVFFYINPIIQNLTGKAPNHFLAKHLKEVQLDVEIIDTWSKVLDKVKDDQAKISMEMEFPSLQGERIMQVNAIPEFNEEEKLESVLIVSHDITESKKIEMEIRSNNKKITESINYAKRIQSAILPNYEVIKSTLPNSFIFYRPRDVVSGDFPWFLKNGEDIYFAVVDCTGHGVPGALISLIGYFILNDIVNSRKISEVGSILDSLNEGVTKTLKQDTANSQTRDGMDISLSKINLKKHTLQYAGANRPLYFKRKDELLQYRGDKFPIGGGKYKNRTSFTTHHIELEPDDEIYMFSDGLPDQFGGPSNKKFAPRQIREIIQNSNSQNMQEMHHIIEDAFENWKGDRKQTDDVLMIGIKF